MQLNFARFPFRNERLPRLVYGLLTLIVVGGTAVHAVSLTRHLLKEREELDLTAQKMQEEIATLDRELAAARTQLAAPSGRSERGNLAQTGQPGQQGERVRFLAGILRQRGFSWTGFFNELEAITPENIRIKSIAPKEEEGEITVRLSVVGRSIEDVLEMVRRLEESRLFASVMPLDEGEEDPREGSGVTATLTLNYQRLPGAEGAEPPKTKSAAPAAGY